MHVSRIEAHPSDQWHGGVLAGFVEDDVIPNKPHD